MYPFSFLLLLSSGVSSCFLPLQETPRRQNETKYTLIDEMLCLLEAEKESIHERFTIPLHTEKLSCAHSNTEIFIHELRKIPTRKCMKIVEQGMQKLEGACEILQKSPSKDKKCSETAKTRFSQFKNNLEEFLKWVNQKLDCKLNTGRSELTLYVNGKCTCHDAEDSTKAWKELPRQRRAE